MSDLHQISGTIAQPGHGCREPDKSPPVWSILCPGCCFWEKSPPYFRCSSPPVELTTSPPPADQRWAPINPVI